MTEGAAHRGAPTGALRLGVAALAGGLVGFAVMGIELTAVRLLAPHFGDSAHVWTNVIGVILLALAAGAWLGGRLAERAAGSPLAGLLAAAALLVAAAPLAARPLGGWLLPQDLPLDSAMPALVRGSLVATALLFAAPVWLLGAISPGLVAGAVRGGAPIGRAAGTVSAAATAGSLAGTFAATHWLVPAFGCRATLWLCAVLLGGAALWLARERRALVALLAVGASLALHGGPLRAPPAGQELLAERESRYQYLQVVRVADAEGVPARRELKINEGLDSFHSVAVEGSAFASLFAADGGTPGGYYDYHALVPLLAGDGERPDGLRVLSIGDAAGTFRRIYAGVHPGAVVDGVELDPAAVALGREHFPGERAPGQVVTGVDGRVFVNVGEDRWHAIHVDAYSHQVYVPAHLASREFFAAARRRLLPGGVVACNVGGLRPDDPVLAAIARTMAAVFGEARALHVPQSRNFLLVARRDRPVDPESLQRYTPGEERLAPGDRRIWEAVLAVGRSPGAWHAWTAPKGEDEAAVLVDDVPRLDRLLDRSYLATLDSGEPVRIAGGESPASAEGAAYAALRGDDPASALAAAVRSREPTAYLRLLCGAARWHLRELRGAEAEFADGLARAPDAELAASLQGQLAAVREELAPRLRAAAVARRNGWLALVAGAAALLALGACLWPRLGAGRWTERRAAARPG